MEGSHNKQSDKYQNRHIIKINKLKNIEVDNPDTTFPL